MTVPARSAATTVATSPPILLVRLKTHQPDGTRVGERERTCHLVPVPMSGGMPEVLRAYCGVPIQPGGADLLPTMSGMPCERCLTRVAGFPGRHSA